MLVLRSAGTVSERGVITCGCKECGAGAVQFSSSEWEVHAGSRERRPAESIYLSEHGISLRVCKFHLCMRLTFKLPSAAFWYLATLQLPHRPGGWHSIQFLPFAVSNLQLKP